MRTISIGALEATSPCLDILPVSGFNWTKVSVPKACLDDDVDSQGEMSRNREDNKFEFRGDVRFINHIKL